MFGIKLPLLGAGESVTIKNNTSGPLNVYGNDAHQREAYAKAMAAAAQQSAAPPAAPPAAPNAAAAPRWSLLDKLAMRLNLGPGQREAFEFMHAVVNPTANTIAVFLIVSGKPLCIEDDVNLFPSDSLIARLNLLR